MPELRSLRQHQPCLWKGARGLRPAAFTPTRSPVARPFPTLDLKQNLPCVKGFQWNRLVPVLWLAIPTHLCSATLHGAAQRLPRVSNPHSSLWPCLCLIHIRYSWEVYVLGHLCFWECFFYYFLIDHKQWDLLTLFYF